MNVCVAIQDSPRLLAANGSGLDRRSMRKWLVRPAISNPNWSEMGNQDKISSAIIMYGRGSRQHLEAERRWGNKGK